MEAIKLLLSLTPAGYAVFLIGLAISGSALLFLRASETPGNIQPVLPPVSGAPMTVVVKIENWQRTALPVKIRDDAGKQAEIEAIVLSNDFNWALESHSKVDRHGETADVIKHLLTPGVSTVIAGYAEVIAVGAASSEGARANPQSEDNRASRRADQLQLWIKEYVPTSKALYSLSIGHFKPGMPMDGDFSAQRKIVIVGVVRSDPGFELSGALSRSLSRVPGFPFDFENYSAFELLRRR